MNAGQWIFYICMPITAYKEVNHDDVCHLPGRGWFRIRDSHYKLMLAKS